MDFSKIKPGDMVTLKNGKTVVARENPRTQQTLKNPPPIPGFGMVHGFHAVDDREEVFIPTAQVTYFWTPDSDG